MQHTRETAGGDQRNPSSGVVDTQTEPAARISQRAIVDAGAAQPASFARARATTPGPMALGSKAMMCEAPSASRRLSSTR